MRSKVVKVMMAQKSMEDRTPKYGLQLFADGGDCGDASGGEGSAGGDGGDDSGDGDEDGGGGAKKYTDEEVDALIERKFAEWQKKHEKQQAKQDEADRLKNMSEQERKDHEMEDLRKQVNDLQKKETMSKMSATARAMLSAKGITVDDALVNMMISEDADATKNAVDAFITAFQKAVSDAVKDALKGETPKAGGSSSLTRDQIMKVKDRAERQRLINENMHLFK